MIPDFEPYERYAESVSSPLPPALADVASRTRATEEQHGMLTGELEGQFLAFLVHCLQPRLVVEIGTFTGFSALAMASALGEDGRVVTCEVDPVRAATAEENIAGSGLPAAGRVEVRVGPALETLASIDEAVDLAFIDADKRGMIDYYEALVPKLSPRGVIVADNVLWGGSVLEDGPERDDADAVRAFNAHVTADARTTNVLLTVRDGVQLIRLR